MIYQIEQLNYENKSSNFFVLFIDMRNSASLSEICDELGSQDHIQEDYTEQINREVLGHSICHDTAQLSPFSLVSFSHLLYFYCMPLWSPPPNLLSNHVYFLFKFCGAHFLYFFQLSLFMPPFFPDVNFQFLYRIIIFS